jgi:hypothetical protein
MHELAEGQDTPSRLLPSEPAGLGVAWIFQDALAAGETAADPAPAASAAPASMKTDPTAKVTETTTADTTMTILRTCITDLLASQDLRRNYAR